jgi:ribosomal-protein-alanine N-acetyltransferase
MSEIASFPVIQTERLILREITQHDAPDLFAIHGDAELMRWFGSDPLPNLAGAEALIKTFASWRVQANPGTRWAIQRREMPKLLGTCGLFAWNRNWRKCAIGYELAPDAQRQGFMHEALSAIIAWGFGQMDLNRIEAQVHPENTSSLKLLEMLREGLNK